jgi:hypothetical protein
MLTDFSEKPARQNSIWPPAPGWFLVGLIFDPEYVGNTFLRNFCSHTDYIRYVPEDGNINFSWNIPFSRVADIVQYILANKITYSAIKRSPHDND